jgi:hypothetical protein
MPQENDTLLAQLLQKANGSIGPTQPGSYAPDSKFENQQPDPFETVLDFVGDPLSNATPVHGIGAVGPIGGPKGPKGLAGKAFQNTIENLVPPNLAHSIKEGPAVEELIRLLEGFNPAPIPYEQSARKAALLSRVGGYNLPDAPKINVEIPKALRMGTTDTTRDPILAQKVAEQAKQKQRLIPDTTVHTIAAPEELKDVVPAGPERRGAPPITGKNVTGAKNSMMKAGNGKLNAEMVLEIRNMKAQGIPFMSIQKRYPNISEATLRDAYRGMSWSWVKPPKVE